MKFAAPAIAAAVLLLAGSGLLLSLKQGVFAIAADIMVWPNLRILSEEESRVLTPFVESLYPLFQAAFLLFAGALAAGFLAGWFLHVFTVRLLPKK